MASTGHDALWMRKAGGGTETTVEQTLMRGLVGPHDRGFVLGLPRSGSERRLHGHRLTMLPEGSPPRSTPSLAHRQVRARLLWRERASGADGLDQPCDGPDEPDHLTRDRRDGHHLRRSPPPSCVDAAGTSAAGLSRRCLARLGARNASIRSTSFRPTRACIRQLQAPSTRARRARLLPAFVIPAAPHAGAAGVLRRGQPEMGHRLTRIVEAREVSDLGRHRHRDDQPNPSHGLHRLDHRREAPAGQQIGDLPRQALDPRLGAGRHGRSPGARSVAPGARTGSSTASVDGPSSSPSCPDRSDRAGAGSPADAGRAWPVTRTAVARARRRSRIAS